MKALPQILAFDLRPHQRHWRVAIASLMLGVGASPAADVAQTWPQWRGPNRDAQAPSAPAWPDDLKGLERVWRVELGSSYSGPIIAADRIFTTESVKDEFEAVHALDRATGKEIWKTQWKGSMDVPFFAARNGDWIRATPAYDGQALFVAGMRDVLVCLEAADGKERWRIDFAEKYGTGVPAFGFVPSPLVDGEFVYAQAADSFVKLKKSSGDVVWRALDDKPGSMMDDGGFSSPVFATIAGVRQIVVQTRRELCGLNPESGAVLWRKDVPSFRGCNILTPTIIGDDILTSTYQNKTFFYGVARQGEAWTVSDKWTSKGQGYMSSPVVIGKHAYLPLGNGRLVCLDLASGAETWRTNKFGAYWSMIAKGDRVLALDETGELVLFAANPAEFQLIDRRKIAEEECWAHLATADRELAVRELKGLSLWRWK